MLRSFSALLALAAAAQAWMPRDTDFFNKHHDTSAPYNSSITDAGHRTFKRQISASEIRGVNLGSLFIMEPWMASTEWASMGCGSAKSEFDCVLALGQAKANSAFQKHWSTWITAADLDTMKSYGLNTIRIPVGYWIHEELVYGNSEHFPQGGLQHLDRIVGAAADRNLFVIMDLHGAPNAQVKQNAFTGQSAPATAFYGADGYGRAAKFLAWMAARIHTNAAYRSVGVLELLNEPEAGHGDLPQWYSAAVAAIRTTEAALQIAADRGLHVQMMDRQWGAGDPNGALSAAQKTRAAYDNHRYLKWDPTVANGQPADYLAASCRDVTALAGNWPLVVGEWSLSTANDNGGFAPAANKGWYTKWWAAQVQAYEKQDGWVFWSWKTSGLNDYRWDYQLAVQEGVIPKDPSTALSMKVC